MTAYEMMLSESQERMLMVLRPEKEAEARAVFEKWDLDFAIVGETIAEDRFVIARQRGVADLPLSKLSSEAPEYDRPWVESPPAPEMDVPEVDPIDALKALIASPNYCRASNGSTSNTTPVMADTSHARLGAGIVRVHGTDKALAFTSDVTPRYVRANPVEGGKQAVAEAFRNLCAVGAQAAGHHRQPQFRQPRKARDHGPVRRRDQRHRRGLQGARHADRVGQRLALQRDRRTGDPAHAHHRRGGADLDVRRR
jgi:phosphoribosylformylglycinamidine (FGAM) synthase-like enzyme